MSPYGIKILLHYYAIPEEHEDAQRTPPIWTSTIDDFLLEGLLRPSRPDEIDPSRYATATFQITERGRAYCDALQRVPLPVQVWVIPSP